MTFRVEEELPLERRLVQDFIELRVMGWLESYL
jgi:hypothetical protein